MSEVAFSRGFSPWSWEPSRTECVIHGKETRRNAQTWKLGESERLGEKRDRDTKSFDNRPFPNLGDPDEGYTPPNPHFLDSVTKTSERDRLLNAAYVTDRNH